MSSINKISDFIAENNLVEKDEKILLAVSGGMDSMSMLYFFSQTEIPFAVAHCNFQLRDKEADLDEELVEETTKKLNITFHNKSFNTKKYALVNRLSIQEAARDLRYEWFTQLCEDFAYAKVATAHHLDDSIETILINIHRGTGIKGLRGILPQRENIIRPLIFLRREEIKVIAEKNKLEFREDQSNKDNKYLRNEIRNIVIPKLKDKSVDFYGEWQEKIELNNQLWKAMGLEIQKAEELCFSSPNTIQIEELRKFKNPQDILFYLLEDFGFSNSQRIEASKLIEAQTGKRILGKTHDLLKDRESLILFKKELNRELALKIEEATNEIKLEESDLYITEEDVNNLDFDRNENVAFLNMNRLKFPLELRNWRQGDIFKPLGMKGMKKVSDFLVDIKLSRFEKEKQLVLTSNEEIVWLVGKRISEDYKLNLSDTKALKLEWRPK